MNRAGVVLILLLAFSGAGFAQQPAPIPTLPLAEVSGAVSIGNDRVLVVADEKYDVRLVSSAQAAFKDAAFEVNMKPLSPEMAGGKESKKIMDDIEDVAWDPARGVAFVITSHSKNKDEDPKTKTPGRHKLARLELKDGALVAHQELDALGAALQEIPFVAKAMMQGHQLGGEQGMFNIEGLAFDPAKARLLIGLRSPTLKNPANKSSAVVLVLENPHALFGSAPQAAVFSSKPMLLDLGGLGIRGMTYDPNRKGVWIVAGRSADPDEEPADSVLSSVWFWDFNDATRPPRKAPLDLRALKSLEGIALLDRGGQQGLLLISDDGKGAGSRYLWVPVPKL